MRECVCLIPAPACAYVRDRRCVMFDTWRQPDDIHIHIRHACFTKPKYLSMTSISDTH